MAGLAAGAVNSLLGLIRNEALLLSHVRGDVRFIKEEMESMKSFLAHLERMTPPGGSHDEQVLTWMKQVEDLAHDCRDCIIVLYMHRGDPEVHRAIGGIQRYLRWFPWFVQKMVDQHRAAIQLRELKERARDVCERRKRYDVEVPTKPPSSQAGRVAGSASGALGYEEDGSDNEASMDTADDESRRRIAVEPSSQVDYFTETLSDWLKLQRERVAKTEGSFSFASISIVVPDQDEDNISRDIVHQSASATHFGTTLWINLADVHQRYATGTPLFSILREREGQGTSTLHGVEDEILREMEESKVSRKMKTIIDNIEHFEKDMILKSEKNKAEESKCMAPIAAIIVTDEQPLAVLQQVLSRILVVQPRPGPTNPTYVAEMLKCYMEGFEDEPQICLHTSQYEYVLRKVFLDPDPSSLVREKLISRVQKSNHLITTLGQDNIVINGSSPAITSASETASGIISKAIIGAAKEAKNKMDDITRLVEQQILVKGILDKIVLLRKHKETLIVLQDEKDHLSGWMETVNALSLLPGTSHGPKNNAVIIITTNNCQKAKDYCYPQRKPMTLSLVEFYYEIVLKLITSQRKNEDAKKNPQVFHDILEKCNPDEFCMKVFVHALYANPNRSYGELIGLHEALDHSKDSLATSNSKKMFKFSYNDLSNDYKSCFLYLAIFPPGDVIKRSTIVGRWITEGLIAKEDWSSSVQHADRCFSTLINRWFIYATDIGATGKAKSCVIGDLVHGFISKIAKKERIVDTRLSYYLAHHFSIFSGLQLNRSDTIYGFVQKLPEYSPHLPLVKVLDLEGCCFFRNNYSYLKSICNKMLLLKCLSLRGTDVNHLPSEINNLHDLEILDIRQTRVPVNETRHVLLLKLRRLLAGDTDPSASSYGIVTTKGKHKPLYSYVSIPYKIKKMENLEVLSNVMVSLHGKEFKDISKLLQLRKLGVVIHDNEQSLLHLLAAIADLKECLQSISITIAETRCNKTSGSGEKLLAEKIYNRLIQVQPSKGVESVRINGYTKQIRLLSLLGKGSSEIAKVALSGTLLNQKNLDVLDSHPKLRYIRLRHLAYNDPELIFNKEEFEHLKFLHVDGYNMTNINFMKGAAVALEKIVLSSTNIKFLYGVGHLPMLKELELIGNELLDSISGEPFPRKRTETESPSEDIAPPQRNTELVSLPKDGSVPQDNTQLIVSPPDDGSAPQENTQPCEVLQKNTERNITFKKEEFQHLKHFRFEDSKMTNIIFEDGGAPELEKIIMCIASRESKVAVSGSLPKLREIEVKGDKSIFLPLVNNAKKANKVTLCDTLLNKDADLYKLLSAKQSLCCLVLLDNSYEEMELSFDKNGFSNLNLLIIKCSKIRNIHFNSGSCPKLEKIIWFYNECAPPNEIQISGMDNIGKLKELELNGDNVPRQLRNYIREHKNNPVLTHKIPEHEDAEKHGKQQVDAPCFPRFSTSYFSKKKDQQ